MTKTILGSIIAVFVGLLTAEATGQAPSTLPDYAGQVMLIKNTLTAMNHANLTGNYTVLRDLGSDDFRRRHNAADLAKTFAAFRERKLDLSPVLVQEPQLTEYPGFDPNQRLRLVGFFPTRPQAVRFVLLFQQTQGAWVIDEVSLGIAPLESVTQALRPQQPAAPAITNNAVRTAQQPGQYAPQGGTYRR